MASDTQSDDGVLVKLAEALRNRSIPPADCPKCDVSDAVSFIPGLPRRQWFGGLADYTFGVCSDCGEFCGLTVTLMSLEGDLCTHAYGFPRPLISTGLPKQEKTFNADDIVGPPYMPASVASLFRQARHNLVLCNWDAGGMMYRKTLEVALCVKFGIMSHNLKETIKRVSTSQPALFKLFASLTREVGNDAAHEEQFSAAGAILLDSQLEQLVVYLFTVSELKAQVAGSSSAATRTRPTVPPHTRG